MRLAIFTLALAVSSAVGHAAPPGEVSRRSYWRDGLIWSDLEVVGKDGRRERRTVRGGTVAGVGMVEYELLASPVAGYVRTTTYDAVIGIRWPGRCVAISPDPGGVADLAPEEVSAILDRSMENWMTATTGCSDLRLVRGHAYSGEVGLDGINRIRFRQDRWCRPATANTAEVCHREYATAITRVFFIDRAGRPDDGFILDADIEINAVGFAVSTRCESACQSAGLGTPSDLENTLTHEIGHLLGLAHTCWDGVDPPVQPVDDEGQPVPLCDGELSLDVIEATMFPFEEPGEIDKRSLAGDDVEAICDLYPRIEGDDDTCEAPLVESVSPFGCSIAVEPSGDPWDLAVVCLLLSLAVSATVRRCG